MNDKIMWWGYIHTSGTLHAKRYFDKRDLQDAEESDFVDRVFRPIEGTREDILKIMEKGKA